MSFDHRISGTSNVEKKQEEKKNRHWCNPSTEEAHKLKATLSCIQRLQLKKTQEKGHRQHMPATATLLGKKHEDHCTKKGFNG